MRTMRYIVSLIAILSVVSVAAATFGKPYQAQRRGIQYSSSYSQMPMVAMSSTGSDIMNSGSALPLAAVSGTITADQAAPSGPTRAKKDGFADDDDTPGQGDTPPDLPGDTVPLGDAAIPLALLALGYMAYLTYKTSKSRKRLRA